MTFITVYGYGAHGKNPSVVKVMCFISFFFIQDNPGQVCKQEYGFEQCSNYVDCVRCICCHYIFTNYSKYYFQVMYQLVSRF